MGSAKNLNRGCCEKDRELDSSEGEGESEEVEEDVDVWKEITSEDKPARLFHTSKYCLCTKTRIFHGDKCVPLMRGLVRAER